MRRAEGEPKDEGNETPLVRLVQAFISRARGVLCLCFFFRATNICESEKKMSKMIRCRSDAATSSAARLARRKAKEKAKRSLSEVRDNGKGLCVCVCLFVCVCACLCVCVFVCGCRWWRGSCI